jgi:Holliday junction resolvase
MLISSVRQKGKQLEREVAEWVSRITGVKYRRTPNSGAIRQVDLFAGDIMKIELNKATVLDECVIECKNCKTLSVPSWLKQVESECEDAQRKHFVIFFKNRGKLYTILPIDYLEKLLNHLKGERQ